MKNLGIASILKQAQKIQDEIAKIKLELVGMKVVGSAGGGMVEVIANGRQQIIEIKIEPDLVNGNDVEMLEDLVVAAVNQALEKSQELANEHLNKATGGMLGNLPEGLKIPGFGT